MATDKPADEPAEEDQGLSEEAKAFWAKVRHDQYCWPNWQF